MTLNTFSDWLVTPQGRYVLDWEQSRLDILLSDIFGFNAVQVGLADIDLLRSNRMPVHCRCATRDGHPAQVRCAADALPFASNSVDLVVLPHVLEFDLHPHQVLREAARVLVPEGSVVITGFNPFSLWGIRRHLSSRTGQPPWNGRYISVSRLKDWCALLDLEPRAGDFGCYAPAVAQEVWLRRLHFLDLAGARWWGFAGGVYMIQAIKRVVGMHRIMPRWRTRQARAKAIIPVTAPSGLSGNSCKGQIPHFKDSDDR